jgi:GrpB-like predicted nucleotidyltransferase (UPF0157 family)/8-oxo-dGTP pyrophosphatase MutT (NUDIX family)
MNRSSVSLSSHQKEWAKAFALIEKETNDKIPARTKLHHIGSTSIPGIQAKPILDILGVVTSVDNFDKYQSAMESLGFIWKGEYGIPNRRYCVLYDETGTIGLVHLHVFAETDKEVERHLIFRDYLINSADAAMRYQETKSKLAAAFTSDRTKYSEGKSELITQLLGEAFAWKDSKKQKHQVVAAIISKENKFLMGKRSLTKKSCAGFWSPICGRIESGESENGAVEREVFEEVGLTVKAIQKVAEMDTRDKSALIHWWSVDVIKGEAYLKNDEHSELRWLSIDEMEKLDNIFSEDIEIFIRAEILNKKQ